MSDQENTPSESVQLTRMEGVMNLVDYKVTSMITQVDAMKKDISKLQTDVHTLQLESASSVATAKIVATALEKSDEERVHESEKVWTPVNRFIGLIVGLGVVINIAIRLWG